ncbi:MAG: hypothetical protein KF902_02490 [Phycisphaeraceae bacterium]|nr:hypothetical protein [Phycisphaeraceae bacterium]MCW5768321.1 hypothetical protein [Phycisphaeraceae bacterium]
MERMTRTARQRLSGRGIAWAMMAAATSVGSVTHADTTDASRAELAELKSSAASGAPAGHDGSGFFIGSEDGAFKLKIGGQIQFRYVANFRDEPTDSDDDYTGGFQTRRERLEFSGNVINKETTFLIQTDFSRSNGGASLLDAWVRHSFNENWSLRFGQFKAPLLREELVSGKRMLAADRSITNGVFTQARSQGIQLEYDADRVKLAGAFTDGLNTLNTDFDSSTEADYGLTGRAEILLKGDWKRFADFTSWRGSDFGAMVGVAGHWQSGGSTGGTTDTDVLEYTVDLSLEGNGWNAFAAFIGRSTDPASGEDVDDFGVVVQGGAFLTDKTELFARYDVVMPDDDRGSSSDDFSTVTVGVNHYFIEKSHAAKFTADLLYFIDAQSDSSSLVSRSTGVGLLPDTEEGQVAARLQFQLLF